MTTLVKVVAGAAGVLVVSYVFGFIGEYYGGGWPAWQVMGMVALLMFAGVSLILLIIGIGDWID